MDAVAHRPAAPAAPPVELEAVDLGVVPYLVAERLQERAAEACREGTGPATLFLLEHPHVVTLGRNADGSNLRVSARELERRGVELRPCSRGGDVTYHGPGQLVGYPVMCLPEGRRQVHRYVRDLEEGLIRALADLGIEAGREPGLTGVWVGAEKLAAIGVRIARWTTTHGFALNVTTDLDYFRLITPCGLVGRGVTSIERLLGRAPAMAEVKRAVGARMRQVFGA
jgi:lipoyl(octanoyl) transferase